MGKPNSKTTRIAVIVVLLIIMAVILRELSVQSESALIKQSTGILRAIIYFGLFITWGLSIRQRIMQKQARSYLLFTSGLIVFWLAARTARYFFVTEDPYFYRWLWYSYYIPWMLIPLTGVFVALYLGKGEDYRLPKWVRLLYIPAFLLSGLVLTNDLHQYVFVLSSGDSWIRLNHEYGIGFWLTFAWLVLCTLTMFGILIAKSRVPRSRKILWLPFVPFLTAVAYAILYIIRLPIIHAMVGDMTVVFCLLVTGVVESCIQVGLIRSNTNYIELFYASGTAAQIVDKDYKVHYRTEAAPPLSEETMRHAENGPIELNKNTRLSGAKVTGGHILWLEDISEINRILSELKKVGEFLTENNALLEAEVELKERQAAVDEKNRLYDKVTKKVGPQLRTLNKLLSEDSAGVVPEREKLIYLCILGAYIKRRSNLIILSEDDHVLFAKELEYCLRESTDTISDCGIPCWFKCWCEGPILTEYALLAYDSFEEIIELALPNLTALLVNLRVSDGVVELKLQLDCGVNPSSIEILARYIEINKIGNTNIETIEGALHIALCFPGGGGCL